MRPNRVLPPGHRSFRHHTVLPRVGDAFRGLVHAYREEPNLRFHAFASTLVLVAAVAVKPEAWETAYLTVTVLLVLVAETVNTAVERTVDLAVNERYHPLAGQAKEVAAGAVLLVSLHALFGAYLVFIGRRGLVETWTAVMDLLRRSLWWGAFPLVAAVLGLVAGRESGKK
ncbi:MAG TPA: diacylglycerol kinase family protein [Symbiobacteriaceae bacterium]